MITTSDMKKILITDSRQLGISEIYENFSLPKGEVSNERIVVITENGVPETFWEKCFCYVNILVPDVDAVGNPNSPRLEDMERSAKKLFKSQTGCYDGSWYEYEWQSIGIEEARDLRCHYVSVRILFKVLNLIKE